MHGKITDTVSGTRPTNGKDVKMNIYRLWDITDRQKKKLLIETIDKHEIDGKLTEIRDKMLDTDHLIMLEQKISRDIEEYID